MLKRFASRWELSARGREHSVEIVGSLRRTVTWHVDGRQVAQGRSFDDSALLEPGDRLDQRGPAADPQPELGAVRAKFTTLGRPRRVTWYLAQDELDAKECALLDRDGIDLDPEPGSRAALREERIRRNPRRHAAVAVLGGLATVGLPLLLGLLAVPIAVSIPWPDWDLPSVPLPDVDLPSIPWPDWDLPDWQAPAWLGWLADKVKYAWPVALAWFLARTEISRRRRQDELKARLRAETGSGALSSAPGPATGDDGQGRPTPG